MVCAIIMAGGKGTRVWPLSTEKKPKQFLNLLGEKSMIQETVSRLEPIVPKERVFVVTSREYVDLVREQLPSIQERNIIIEPEGKNTAPCIMLAAMVVQKYYRDATLVVLPSDHLIKDKRGFQMVMEKAVDFVENNEDAIVTVGIKPDRAETGYGYIKVQQGDGEAVKKVERFVEKPSLEKARVYLEDGNYLWNGGMFIWKGKTVLKLSKEHQEENYKVLSEVAATSEEEFQNVLNERYREIEAISVDYGIMENAKEIFVIPAQIGWDDLGTWESYIKYLQKDERANIYKGDAQVINGENNIIVSGDKKIVLSGVEDVFVVEGENLILICDRGELSGVKDIKGKVEGK